MVNNMSINQKIVEKILECFKNTNRDLTLKEIAEKTGLTRTTVRTYLVYLLATGKIEETRQIGKSKFYKLKNKNQA